MTARPEEQATKVREVFAFIPLTPFAVDDSLDLREQDIVAFDLPEWAEEALIQARRALLALIAHEKAEIPREAMYRAA